eukprot:TRINITY_DN12140_c0_g2_i1.p2 TRINITY_DN12140_c0_g2~~TRINITY_DN12140_c0_g2_i1.p2  ORF type:complete len:388 (+),score=136.61 TRINITY_DN12140_c0_g2_i1:45-1166(+)
MAPLPPDVVGTALVRATGFFELAGLRRLHSPAAATAPDISATAPSKAEPTAAERRRAELLAAADEERRRRGGSRCTRLRQLAAMEREAAAAGAAAVAELAEHRLANQQQREKDRQQRAIEWSDGQSHLRATRQRAARLAEVRRAARGQMQTRVRERALFVSEMAAALGQERDGRADLVRTERTALRGIRNARRVDEDRSRRLARRNRERRQRIMAASAAQELPLMEAEDRQSRFRHLFEDHVAGSVQAMEAAASEERGQWADLVSHELVARAAAGCAERVVESQQERMYLFAKEASLAAAAAGTKEGSIARRLAGKRRLRAVASLRRHPSAAPSCSGWARQETDRLEGLQRQDAFSVDRELVILSLRRKQAAV